MTIKLKYTLSAYSMEFHYQCYHFDSQLMEIYVNFNRSPLTIYKRPLVTLCRRRFWSTISFAQSRTSAFFSRECWFPPNLSTNNVSHLCWPHSAVSFRCMQITISNKSGIHTNQYPTCHHWNYCSSLKSWALSEWDVKNYGSVTRCCVKRPA